MKHRQMKLELTWAGKELRMRSHSHALIERAEKSYSSGKEGAYDNKLIYGDNLVALKELKKEFSGRVKCIYIDPPYNIDASGVPYDDSISSSVWLSLMRDRLEILRSLLSDEGLIFIQINDEMLAYLSLVMDELFGKENKLNVIAVKMSEASGVKMTHAHRRLPKIKEYILVYKKSGAPKIDVEKISIGGWNHEYNILLTGIEKEEVRRIKSFMKKEKCDEKDVEECINLLKKAKMTNLRPYFKEQGIREKEQDAWKFDNAWRIILDTASFSVYRLAKKQPKLDQDIGAMLSPTGLIYLYKTKFDASYKKPRIQIVFADDFLFRNPCDLWLDIKTAGGQAREGGNLFLNSKKPEALLKRIIGMCTKPGDIVLDCFAGSGTTLAVAHKMGRRWIGIELGEHCDSHCVPRLQKVVDGTDQTGVSKEVNWNGGGGFRYYHLELQTKEN